MHTILRPLLPYRSTPITTPPLPNQPLAHPAALNRAAAGNAVHSAAPFEQRADSWARHAPRPPQELLLGGHFWGPGGLPEELGELVRLARLDLGGLPLLHDWLRDPAARRRHALAPVRDSSRVTLSAPPPPPPPIACSAAPLPSPSPAPPSAFPRPAPRAHGVSNARCAQAAASAPASP